jgi:hypothetical protein
MVIPETPLGKRAPHVNIRIAHIKKYRLIIFMKTSTKRPAGFCMNIKPKLSAPNF